MTRREVKPIRLIGPPLPPPWRAPLLGALWVVLAWVGCVGVGALFTWLGHLHGCQLNEGGVHPCLVWGLDVGSPLYMLSVAPLLLASFGILLFLMAIMGCLGFAAVMYAWHVFRRKRE
jgi:hypothetical protein